MPLFFMLGERWHRSKRLPNMRGFRGQNTFKLSFSVEVRLLMNRNHDFGKLTLNILMILEGQS